MKIIHLLFISMIFLFSCEKNKSNDPVTPFKADSGGVYISNEGNFQSANSSVTYYNPANGLDYVDAYKGVNYMSLGDVCQSMNLINGKLFVVVNNSGKIEVCDPFSMGKIKTITGLTSPRYIVPVSNSKAYVSDTYADGLSIINLDTYLKTGSIPIKGWTEQMLHVNGKVFVTDEQSDYLYVIDPSNDIVSDSILLSRGANSIREDNNGKIWVLAGGDYLQHINGALYRIDPTTKTIEVNLPFTSADYPTRLCTNGSNDTIYFLNNGVWRMSTNDIALPSAPFIVSTNNNFYGLGIDPKRHEIYVSDGIDFVQRGKILRYKADGTLKNNFLAGIIPGDFLFLP